MNKGQIFGIATYDALFKWVLSEDSIRPSFFQAFVPGITVRSSQRLDDHMNPLQELQNLRNLINDSETDQVVASLRENYHKVGVHIENAYHEKATLFLKGILHHFDDIRYSFPKPPFNGAMDFVCQLDTEEYALVEMQIIPENDWDQRALAYVASFYGSQLRRKASWKEIRKVIGVNILGGGKNEEKHWKDIPNQYVRHYKFQEQLNQEEPPRILNGIEIIQYSLSNAPEEVDSQEQKDWLRFLKDSHKMTEEEVREEIKTPAVLAAFERARLASLPQIVRNNYDKQDLIYENVSEYVAEKTAQGKAEGIAEGIAEGMAKGKAEGIAERTKEMAQIMLNQGIEMSVIQMVTGLSTVELELLQQAQERD